MVRIGTENTAQQRSIDIAKRGYSDIKPVPAPKRQNSKLISSMAWQEASRYISNTIVAYEDIINDLMRSIVPEVILAERQLREGNTIEAIETMKSIEAIQLDYISTIRVIAGIDAVRHNVLSGVVEPKKVGHHVDEIEKVPHKRKSSKNHQLLSSDEELLQKLMRGQFFPYVKNGDVQYIYYRDTLLDEDEYDNDNDDNDDDDDEIESIPDTLPSMASTSGLLSLSDVLRNRVRKIYNVKLDCFGFYTDDVVDCMMSSGLATSTSDAIRIGRSLQNVGSIHNLKSNKKFDDARLFFGFRHPERKDWRERLDETGAYIMDKLVIGSHTYMMRVYEETFTGNEMVDLLLESGTTSSRQDAVWLGRAVNAQFNIFRHYQNEYELEDKGYLYTFNTYHVLSVQSKKANKGKIVERYKAVAQTKMMKTADRLRMRLG
jgi:hypothetical protein